MKMKFRFSAHGNYEAFKLLQFTFCWWGSNYACRQDQRSQYIDDFYAMARVHGYVPNYFFSLYADKDKKNSTTQILYVSSSTV